MPSRTRPMSVATPTSILIAAAPTTVVPDPDLVARLDHGRGHAASARSRTCRSSSRDPPRTRRRSCRRSGRAAMTRYVSSSRQLALGRASDHHARAEADRRAAWPSVRMHDDGRTGCGAAGGGSASSHAGAPEAGGGIHREAADDPAHRAPHEQEQQREQAVLQQREREGRDVAVEQRHPSRNSSTVVPIVMRSPSSSARVWTVCPFRRVPFVDPRSVRRPHAVLRSGSAHAAGMRPCRPSTTSHSGRRPIVMTS